MYFVVQIFSSMTLHVEVNCLFSGAKSVIPIVLARNLAGSLKLFLRALKTSANSRKGEDLVRKILKDLLCDRYN